jgi:ferredoxin/flavodoxin---NADP+ reductase
MRCSLPAKEKNNFLVAVIGAGPAGLFASRYLARQGVQVVLFNRDIKPGGLAEYGIFPDKHKMRTGLMSQFKRILEIPSVRYQGNVKIGKSGDIELDQLRQAGFQALMVTTGAQQNNWLGLPGEDLDGVYQANDIVFHYNHLPERPEFEFKVGREVVVIGVGNVMLDIVHYLKKSHIPCTVTAYARRGPAEVKFDQQTLEPVASCLDLQVIKAAVDGALPEVQGVGNNVNKFYLLLEKARMKAKNCDSDLKFQMRFLRSPRRLVGDEHGRVKEIVFEVNNLVRKDDQVESRGSGVLETVAADTVIFSVGSRVDDGFGLPVAHGNFVTNPEPRFPVDGISYEVYNPDLCARCEDIFVSGWARSAGEGIVGLARKDAERGAKAVLAYLDSLDLFVETRVDAALERLPALDKTIVDLADLEKIWNAEQKIAAERGLPAFKFPSQKALLRVIKES